MNSLRPPLWGDIETSSLLENMANPPDRYRPIPWLAWTGELAWPGLKKQLQDMQEKGITEFILFPIYGMELPYMSAVYWERVGQTLDFCKSAGMKCWIYDEFNWPSGSCAGQMLSEKPETNSVHLWIRTDKPEPKPLPECAREKGATNGVDWAMVPDQDIHSNVRGSDWCNRVPGFLDVLDDSANQEFIRYTHNRYHQHFADHFPDTVAGFFTDEPGVNSAPQAGWCRTPYPKGMEEEFRARYGYDLKDRLADLIQDSETSAQTRCDYWVMVAEKFGNGFGGQQRAWCDERGVALTGHLFAEESLHGHVSNSGDLWEALRNFTIPGVDMLSNADGFNYPYDASIYPLDTDRRGFHLTCKMVHSIVRHIGGREMMSEAYGVCHWKHNLALQKRGFNYQVAMGVTYFNDNSLITSIAEFRKWAIAGKHFTQPWWQHYKLYADYNAKLAAMHAEGEAVADVAVLYPRSTIWARHSIIDREGLAPLQDQIYDLLDELIRAQWHFDFIFEPVLQKATMDGSELVTEHARYKALVVPGVEYLPTECLQVIEQFAAAGGTVIFSGDLPARDPRRQADLSEQVQGLLAGENVSNLDGKGSSVCRELSGRLEPLLTLSGEGSRDFISSRRRFAGQDVIFVANMADHAVNVEIAVHSSQPLLVRDPDTQESYRPKIADNGRFSWHFEPGQSFLLMPDDGAASLPCAPAWLAPTKQEALADGWEISLEGGNLLRLTTQLRPDPMNQGGADGWQRDCGEEGWIDLEENGWLAEPLLPAESPWYWMRSFVDCAEEAVSQTIICDSPHFLELYVNGVAAPQVPGQPLWTEENVFFDVSGLFVAGRNSIHVRARTSKYNDPRIGIHDAYAKMVQPVVLQGEFSVDFEGGLTAWSSAIDPKVQWEKQGLPNFSGMATYQRQLGWDGQGQLLLLCPESNDVVEARVNGVACGVRGWAPRVFDLSSGIKEGENNIELVVRNTLANIIIQTYGGMQPEEGPSSGLLAAPVLLKV